MTAARRTTVLLAALVIVGAGTAALAWSRAAKYRDDAAVARRNLDAGRAAMAQIRQWRSSPGRAAPVMMESSQLTAKLREAARAAGLADAPGITTTDTKPVASSDYSEVSVYLALPPLTLKQLTTFLHALARIEPSSRATQIDLSSPQEPGAARDVWKADVAVGYLTYSPRKSGR